jgi:hypothetical protein
LGNDTHVEMKLLDILYDKDTDEVWSTDKILGYNQVFRLFSWNMRGCQNPEKAKIPTKYNLSSIEFDGSCQLRGNGTKNIGKI